MQGHKAALDVLGVAFTPVPDRGTNVGLQLFRHSLDGQQFVTDLRLPVKPGTRLLLLSADAGG